MTTFEEALANEPTPDFDELVETLRAGDDEFAVRLALVRIARAAAEVNRLKMTLAEISDRYRRRMAGIESEVEALRDSVQVYLERFNGGKSLAFPDVGTAYLTTRTGVQVVDPELFAEWAVEQGIVQTVPALNEAKDRAKSLALDDGELVPGIDVVRERKVLGIRSAS